VAGRIPARTRVLVATAAVVSGLALGVLVVGLAGGARQPALYQPFFAGLQNRLTTLITADGPVFYPDPNRGNRGFYLDVEDGKIVALHVIVPGTDSCAVQWDRAQKRYLDCHGAAVDPSVLERYLVTTQGEGDKTAIFVDLRTVTPRS
jgi:hypothetical protein